MKTIINPTQNWLFDPFEAYFSEPALRKLQEGWSGIFRKVILAELPAHEVGEHFSIDAGRPTKELYSICGLLLLKEMFDWTEEETADKYVFDSQVQYALNIGRDNQSLDVRTVQRYEKLFREDDLAQKVMDRVTIKLIGELDLDVSKQRLDSTHIKSNMATFGRLRLFGVTIKRFLTQVLRHEKEHYEQLPKELIERYQSSENRLFSQISKEQSSRQEALEQSAKDLHLLLEYFMEIQSVCGRSSYKAMERLLKEQCEFVESKLIVRKKTGGDVLQNPSDMDAGYDGHKGSGYKAQLAQTCNPDNPVQIITDVIVESAAVSDAHLIQPQLDNLIEKEIKPSEMLADTTYGSDENIQASRAKGVEQISPVPGKKSINDSSTEENKTEKQQRLQQRREEEKTNQWKERYKNRNPIEAANSAIKRRTGMGRLRIRGKPSVSHAIFLKVAGWNILHCVSLLKTLLLPTPNAPIIA